MDQLPDKLNKFIIQLQKDYPDLCFKIGTRFSFRLLKRPVITIDKNCHDDINFIHQTFHELGHALCRHQNYQTDVERLKIERQAWDRGFQTFTKFQSQHFLPISWDETIVENALDTYRDWLHTNSRCKNCGLTCVQTSDGTYHCPRCENFRD